MTGIGKADGHINGHTNGATNGHASAVIGGPAKALSSALALGSRNPPSQRPRTVLVLGGGGMKGVAHVGVLRALEQLKIQVDEIIGTSIGAVVGGFLASGMSVDDME